MADRRLSEAGFSLLKSVDHGATLKEPYAELCDIIKKLKTGLERAPNRVAFSSREIHREVSRMLKEVDQIAGVLPAESVCRAMRFTLIGGTQGGVLLRFHDGTQKGWIGDFSVNGGCVRLQKSGPEIKRFQPTNHLPLMIKFLSESRSCLKLKRA